MNKHLHRIIFNTTRGMRMVVQETASSAGKGQSRATTAGGRAGADGADGAEGAGATNFALTILGLAILLSAPWAHAQIVASPLAAPSQRATVLVAPNGVPLVNITTPSAAGVSRNVYNQFDVNAPGVILNNSRTTVQTQLGGYVQGNPWLATGPARVILNEVNGGNPSQLRGYVEVGGQRAEVIIANPAGINVDGGGFINASRATLTTGTPQLNALGGLDSFLVRGGTVSINGAGLDASKTDYAAILSRALQVNAAINATDLKVVTGANQISADHSQITPATGTGAAPTFALDVSALGGTYANKIVLIGTEAGLGVRNAGSLGASAGSLVVTAAGRLENTGTLEGPSVQLASAGDIDNRGGTIRQTSAASLTLTAPTVSNTAGGWIGAERVPASTSTGSGTSSGSTGSTGSTSGAATSTGTATASGSSGSTGSSASTASPAPGSITASGAILNDGGKVYAGGPISVQTANLVNNGGAISVASMVLNQPGFSNQGGTLNVSGAFTANLDSFNNSTGTLHAGSLDIHTTGDLLNVGGTLTSDTDASLTVGGKLDNTRGTVSAVGALGANVAGAVTNAAGTLLANQALTLSAQSLNNAAKGSIQSSQASVQLAIAQQLNNSTGLIAAATDLGIQAGSLASSGSLRGGNDTGIAVNGALVNDGSITAGRNTTVTAGSVQGGVASAFGAGVQNDGTLAASGDLHITARQGLTALGTNLAAGNSLLQGASVDLSGSKTSAANIELLASAGDVITRHATVVTPGTLGITAHAQPGQTLVNDAGTLNAGQLDLRASNIVNTNGGAIVQTGVAATTLATTLATTIAVTGTLNNDGGQIAVNSQDLTLSGASISNAGGKIVHAGSGTLGVAGGSFSGANGSITSNGALVVAMTGAFAQDGGTTNAKQITVDAGSLSNHGGKLVQSGAGATRMTVVGALDNTSGTLASNGQDMSLSAASYSNVGGQIVHAGSGTLGVAGGSFAGTNGQITSNGALVVNMTGAFVQDGGTTNAKQITVDAGSLSNRSGKLVQSGTGATRITVVGALDNTAGTLASNGATSIAAGSLTNQGGSIRAAGTSDLAVSLFVTTTGLLDNSAKGQIAAGGNAVLRAGNLQNDAGSLTAVGTLGITVSGAASNIGGTIAANGNTSVASASLNNTQGTVAAVNGNLTVTTSGTTTNAGGTLQSGGATTLSNGGLDNTAGKVTGNALRIDTQGQRLSNTQGTLAGTTTVDLRTGALVNTAGLIQSGGAMTVDTAGQTLTNNNAAGYANGQGGIASADTLSLTTGALDNTAGFIGAKKALTASTQGFSNGGGGLVVGQSTVVINTNGATYDNTGGQTQAVGALTVNAGDIANTGGLLRSSGTTTLNAGTIVNAHTSGTNQGIEGQNVVLNVGNLNNTAGAVRGDQNVTITSGGTVDNSNGGLLSAGDTLKVVDPNAANPTTKTLSITNTNGRLVGGSAAVLNSDGSVHTAGYGGVQLDAKTYSATGQLVSGNDLGVRLVGDVTNNVDVSANGNLTYATTGSLTNSGKLLAGGTVTASGTDVNNTATGEIHGDTTVVNAVGTLTNRGLIDGHDTQLTGSTVNNLGTGRIYGDTISIGAGTLNNDTETVGGAVSAGTIAARNTLDIGAGTINNREHAYIFSAGDMFIGGALDANRFAVGSGSTLNNLSASIESLGDVNIAMGTMNNFDTHLTVSKVSSTASTVQLVTLDGKFWSPADTFGDPSTRLVYHTDANGIVSIVGKGWSDWYNTIGTTGDVASNADPARIVAGGNMTLVGHLHNRDSKVVAGGTLTANDVDNESTQGTSTTTVNTVVIGYNPNRPGKPPESPFLLSPVVTTTTYAVGGFEYASHTNAVSGSAPATTGRVGVSGLGGSTGAVASGHAGGFIEVPANVGGVVKTAGNSAGNAGGSTATSANAASGTTSTASQSVPMVVRTSTPELTVPTASLFRTLPGATSHYLVETDPRFANYRTWLSSDYLLAQFGLDPNNTLKRLGDGFYEQMLIRQQVAQLTGYRYVEGFTNDEDEYTALMNAGVTFAKQYNLSVGVALSAAQMAQLTSDIVWLVEQTVTLPDGSTQRVLVPQVYVRVRPGDIDGSGALLSADALTIKSPTTDLANSGTIAGRTVVDITANNVNNLGRISGGKVVIDAKSDLNVIGGSIDARNAMDLRAGGDINVRTTTQSTASGSNIDRIAGLYVTNPGGTLVASAGHDVNLVGAIIANQGPRGATYVSAKNDINLSTVTTGRTVTGIGEGVATSTSQSRELGSTVATNGLTILSAGRDVNARQATVDAGASLLSVHAERDINIESGQTQTSNGYAANWTDKGLSSKTANALTADNATRTSVGSTLSGGMVSLGAGNNIDIEGSHISGTHGVLLVAGNNLSVVEGRDFASGSLSSSSKTSGLGLLGGFIPVAVPVKRGNTTGVDIQTDTALASTISSSQGGVLLQGGGTVYLQGAQVDAAKNIAIAGGNVVVQAATNYSSVTGTHSSNDLNLGAGIWNATPSTGIKAKSTSTTQVQDSTLARTTLDGANVSITATNTLAIAGTTVNTPGTLALNANTLLLGTQATEHSTQTTGNGRDLVYQKSKDNGTSDQATHYDQFNAGTLAVNANHIQAGLGARDSVEALAQQPGMGWVSQLTHDPKLNGKIDWTRIEEVHKQWNHDQQGLTPEGAAIVTLVVVYFTAGAASGIGVAAGNAAAVGAGEGVAWAGGGAFLTETGLTISGVVGGAVTAGVSALASQAAVALINNQGDIGGALHDLGSSASVHNLLTAIVTGGVLGGLQLNPTGLPTAGGGAQGFGSQLGQNLAAGAARAVIGTAINGGSLEQNLQAALKGAILDTVAAQAANAIGTATFGSDAVLNEFTNKLAHAIAGCAVGAVRAGGAGSAGGCAAGALGAAVGELAAETYGRNTDTVQFAALFAGLAVAIAGGDAGQINLGSQAGGNAAANNFLSHQNVDQLQAKLAKCSAGDEVCITAAIESMRGISQANDALLLNCKATNNCDELRAAYRQGSGDLSNLISTGALGSDSNVNRAFSLETPGFIDIANGLYNRVPAGCNLANPSAACIQQSKDFANGLATAGVGLVTLPLAAVGAATTGAVAAGMLSALTQTIDNGSANAGQILVDAATGAITGVLVNGLFQGVSQVVVAAGSRVAQLLDSDGALIGVAPASRVSAAGVNGRVVTVDTAVATGSPITTRFVNGVTVVDQRTGTIFNGTVDLQPTFDRIAAGATGLSRNDGMVFRNLPDRTTGQILLPVKPAAYYTEYVVPTPGISGPGPQRIVTGRSGEMFYTPDHYLTFIPIKNP